MGTVLLYNLSDADKRMKIKLILYRLGLAAKDVSPEDFGCPLGYLLGQEDFAPAGAEGTFRRGEEAQEKNVPASGTVIFGAEFT